MKPGENEREKEREKKRKRKREKQCREVRKQISKFSFLKSNKIT
jgi:hypothetical protein